MPLYGTWVMRVPEANLRAPRSCVSGILSPDEL